MTLQSNPTAPPEPVKKKVRSYRVIGRLAVKVLNGKSQPASDRNGA